LSTREQAVWLLVDASSSRVEPARREMVLCAAEVLTPDEVYLANMVISLFNFYNAFVDVNGVNELSPEGYEASGKRLSTQGYAPVPANQVRAG
jgi:hypothetical protein